MDFNLEGKHVVIRVRVDDHGTIFFYRGIVKSESPAFLSLIDDKTDEYKIFSKSAIVSVEVSVQRELRSFA